MWRSSGRSGLKPKSFSMLRNWEVYAFGGLVAAGGAAAYSGHRQSAYLKNRLENPTPEDLREQRNAFNESNRLRRADDPSAPKLTWLPNGTIRYG